MKHLTTQNRKSANVLSFLLLVLALMLQKAGAAPGDQQKLAAANCDFSFRLLKELARQQPAKNIFISPYSAESCLQMVCNGAGGQTKAEIMKVLGVAGIPQSAINAGASGIQMSLNSTDTNVILTPANAIWSRKDAPVNPAFLSCNQQFFHATIGNLDFSDPHSVETMNAWVANATRGRINQIVSRPIDGATDLFLANAVYFKGKWLEPFDAKATTNRVFRFRGGGEKKIPMMEQSREFDYRRGTGYQAVRLRYEGWSLGMYVFLPDEKSGPEKLLDVLNGEKWQRITKPGFHGQQGTLIWPKFRMEYRVELKTPLKSMGMKRAFGATADFSGISSRGDCVSAVCQKTFVEVSEEGTEAAATTMMALPMSMAEVNPPPPFRMVVDRPFLILIEDENTGIILFSGVIFDPGEAMQ
jgi:serine protease inhibitor